jgi:hypothetical protein
MKSLACLSLCFCSVIGVGCAAPSRAGDPSLASNQVRTEFFTAPEVRIHRFSVKGARMSDGAFHAALTTIESHLHRPIRMIDHGEQADGWGKGGPVAPVQDHGRAVTGADVEAAGGVYRLSEPQDGIVGVARRAVGDGALCDVLADPGVVVVVELPGPDDGVGVTGSTGAIAVNSDGPPRFLPGTIVIEHSVIKRRSNWFVSEAKLSQWTLTHELGHVLGVPASNSHIWAVPGLGPHCTDPRCVMYTGFDWRVLWTGIVRGWPMNFCQQCSKEIEAARSASVPPAPSG